MTLMEEEGVGVIRDIFKSTASDDLRSAIRIHLRLAVASALIDHLQQEIDGGELLFKEVLEACHTDDDRSTVADEIRHISRQLVPGKLPSNLYIFGVIDAARAELITRGTPT